MRLLTLAILASVLPALLVPGALRLCFCPEADAQCSCCPTEHAARPACCAPHEGGEDHDGAQAPDACDACVLVAAHDDARPRATKPELAPADDVLPALAAPAVVLGASCGDTAWAAGLAPIANVHPPAPASPLPLRI